MRSRGLIPGRALRIEASASGPLPDVPRTLYPASPTHSHSGHTMALRLSLTFLLASAPLAAQDYSPDFARIAALVSQVESGDSAAKPELERTGRGLFTWAAQRRVTGTTAHLVARVGLVVGAPFAHPDSAVTQREVFWRSDLVRALHAALATDSGDMVAAELLERLEPYPHIWMEPERELAHLRALAARHTELPTALGLAYVGLELERGDPERAWVMLLMLDREAVGLVRWHHLDAQAHFARGQPYSASRYFEGAHRIRATAEAQVYRDDLEWIAEPEELAAFDALVPGDSTHAVWLRKFWTRRDLEDARMPGTRLREHFARWRSALKEYRWDRMASHAAGIGSTPRMANIGFRGDILFPPPRVLEQAEAVYHNRLVSKSRVLDDRGALVMRHGAPFREVNMPGRAALAQAVLRWETDSGALVVSFSAPGGIGSEDRFGMVARNIPVGDLLTTCQLDSELCALAGLIEASGVESAKLQAERTRNRYQAMRDTAESSDANPERFSKPLEAYVQSYGIAGGGVLVSYAIRARDLESGVARLRIVAGSLADGEIIATTDTTRRWPPTDNPQAFVSGWTVVDAPPGTWRVGVVVSDSARQRGNGAAFDAVPAIAGATCTSLCLSDPILGRESSGLRWNRLGRSIPLNPTGAWLQSEEGVLSAEVYGLVPGRNYRLSIELREGRDANARSRLVITETLGADAPMMFLQRNLSFANLGAGVYRLVMRITDAESGESVERERMVPVR
jgi:hypothetical protein